MTKEEFLYEHDIDLTYDLIKRDIDLVQIKNGSAEQPRSHEQPVSARDIL